MSRISDEDFIRYGKTSLRARLDAWRQQGERIALVPTMGALHAGHLSLVDLARSAADRVVASVFVNPTQFAAGEDFDAYPRPLADDCAQLKAAGCDLVYAPEASEMYPNWPGTTVSVPDISQPLEGQYRPHFFGGVATVVARLFVHVRPDVAVFGDKDFQQLQVIRRMTEDLGFNIEILSARTERALDGLALSSRNAYLDDIERAAAASLSVALRRCAARLRAGSPVAPALDEAKDLLVRAGFGPVDYVEACDPTSLEALPGDAVALGQPCRLLAAAWLGRTRLIDNIDAGTG